MNPNSGQYIQEQEKYKEDVHSLVIDGDGVAVALRHGIAGGGDIVQHAVDLLANQFLAQELARLIHPRNVE